MNLIVCIDDKGGLALNHRRQSSDRVLCQYILEHIGEAKLYMTEYSKSIFPDDERIVVVDDLLETGEDDYCFLETEKLLRYVPVTKKFIFFKWNRLYPSDKRLDIDLASMTKIKEDEFEGFSHEKITMEVYER